MLNLREGGGALGRGHFGAECFWRTAGWECSGKLWRIGNIGCKASRGEYLRVVGIHSDKDIPF